MHPNQEHKFRENTHKESGNYNLRAKVCTRCKKTRSALQYEAHPTICRTCRTGK